MKMEGSVFLSVMHYQALNNIEIYENARRQHQHIRDALAIGNNKKRKLLISEYADYIGCKEQDIIAKLRAKGFKDV